MDAQEVAASLRTGVGLLLRRLKQAPAEGDLTLPESSALSRLDRGGPTTAAELARQEQISPQSMGATLFGLLERGYIEKHPDPTDGRRYLLSVTEAGAGVVHQPDARPQRRRDLLRVHALLVHDRKAKLISLNLQVQADEKH